jgi:hydrogenase/urease accessory protein HupE
MRPAVVCIAIALMCTAISAFAHEARPAYLEITETKADRYSVLWRTPVLSGMQLPVKLALPADARDVIEPHTQQLPDSLVERRVVEVPGGLGGRRIDILGLQGTITDVLVRTQWRDGRTSTELVRPSRPWIDVAAPRGALATAGVFLIQGIEHILLGIDHLLFVFGLLLLVRTNWMLVKTITAFTVAHSITLALATLGYAHIPPAPLNAAIALSILFLGPEIIRAWNGGTSLTIRHPWIVAFVFGLMHGFGFASGLATVGLPDGDIPLALLMFNVGVEIGQLAFVALIILLVRAFKVLQMQWPRWVSVAPAYVVGSLGALWSIQRVLVVFEGS